MLSLQKRRCQFIKKEEENQELHSPTALKSFHFLRPIPLANQEVAPFRSQLSEGVRVTEGAAGSEDLNLGSNAAVKMVCRKWGVCFVKMEFSAGGLEHLFDGLRNLPLAVETHTKI